MAKASQRYLELARASRQEIAAIFGSGEPPSPAAIAGFEFRGYNRGWLARLLRISKFVKAFFSVSGEGEFGCNTPVAQAPLDEDWRAKPDEAAPRRFGFFALAPPDEGGKHPNALLLDYGRGRNPWYQPARLLRDYVVRVAPGSDELLLGRAYLALGPLRIPVTYFLLERRRALPDSPRPPR